MRLRRIFFYLIFIYKPSVTIKTFHFINSVIDFFTIKGKDSVSFLNNLSTSDLKELKKGSGGFNLVLDPKAKIRFLFWNYRLEDGILILYERATMDKFIGFLEKNIFLEAVSLERLKNYISIFWLPKNNSDKKRFIDGIPISTLNLPEDILAIPTNFTFFNDYLLIGKKEKIKNLFNFKKLNEDQAHLLDLLFEKSKWVFPSYFKEEISALSTHWYDDQAEKSISITKGCYPGQEVIARFYSRDRQMATKLVMLEVDFLSQFSLAEQRQKVKEIQSNKIFFKQRNFITIFKIGFSTSFKKLLLLGLANMKNLENVAKDSLGLEVVIENRNYKFKIVNLPLSLKDVRGEKIALNKYYNLGLDFFHQDNILRSKEYFKKALEYNQNDEAVLEALAMCEEKLNNLTKAILLNKKIAQLNPQSVMPHTNLSRLYMLEGKIEAAEAESKQATVLMFKNASQKKSSSSNSSSKVNNSLQRQIDFFKKVLTEIGEDDIAHYQLGKIYYEIKDFLLAQQHLEKVLAINPAYSLAYYYLGLVFREQKKMDDHKKILQKGKAVAKKNGDFTPLKKINYLLENI